MDANAIKKPQNHYSVPVDVAAVDKGVFFFVDEGSRTTESQGWCQKGSVPCSSDKQRERHSKICRLP